MAEPQQWRGFDAIVEHDRGIVANITVNTVGMTTCTNTAEVGREHSMDTVVSLQRRIVLSKTCLQVGQEGLRSGLR